MCTQVLTPLQGGLPQQTGVIIQPQQIVLASGNKVQSNTQVSTSSLITGLTGAFTLSCIILFSHHPFCLCCFIMALINNCLFLS